MRRSRRSSSSPIDGLGGVDAAAFDVTVKEAPELMLRQSVAAGLDGFADTVGDEISGGDAEEEIRSIHSAGVGGPCDGYIKGLRTSRARGWLVDIDCIESSREEVAVNFGHGCSRDLLAMESNVSSSVVDIFLEPMTPL